MREGRIVEFSEGQDVTLVGMVVPSCMLGNGEATPLAGDKGKRCFCEAVLDSGPTRESAGVPLFLGLGAKSLERPYRATKSAAATYPAAYVTAHSRKASRPGRNFA